jgi:S-disulfanyl-L-cysteine oxidoreductase SoxD
MSKFRNLLATAVTLSFMAFGPQFLLHAEAQNQTKTTKKIGLGREAHPDEVKAWDTDVRPDGLGLPPGKGSVKEGEELYQTQCAACHGEFGESAGRWPAIAGGRGSLTKEGPEKTVGSFWPYASTTFDYIKRAMPYGNARSLTDNEVYAITAYLLNMNDIVKDDFILTKENFATIKLPNVDGFKDDDRESAERHFWKKEPCMKNCAPTIATVRNRARMLDVTPENKSGPKVE